MTNKNKDSNNIKESVGELMSQIYQVKVELESLNREYGGRIRSLTKEQQFKCDKCGYEETFTLHEKILNGNYTIESRRTVVVDETSSPLYFLNILILKSRIRCGCNKSRDVPSKISAEHALKVLREERDLVEKGKKPPDAYMLR